MAATGLEARTTYLVNEHATIWPNWPVWPNDWAFVCELSGSGFKSSCRFCACFEQGVPWHSGNYRVWIHSETRTWHEKNIHSWKRRLSNYKIHVKKKKCLWRIVRHFIGNYNCYGVSNLRCAVVDGLNNVHRLKAEGIDDLLL